MYSRTQWDLQGKHSPSFTLHMATTPLVGTLKAPVAMPHCTPRLTPLTTPCSRHLRHHIHSRCTMPPCGPTGVREVLEVLTCITQVRVHTNAYACSKAYIHVHIHHRARVHTHTPQDVADIHTYMHMRISTYVTLVKVVCIRSCRAFAYQSKSGTCTS